MTIKVREWKKSGKVGFEVDIRFTYPDGTPYRERRKAPVESKTAARRWAEARERELLSAPLPTQLVNEETKRKEVPTLETFGPRFIEGYARANKHKASGVHTKERILVNHLYPHLGAKRLDEISNENVQQLKAKLTDCKAKTINNILNVLSRLLNVAAEWGVIEHVPCKIKLLKSSAPKMAFYEYDEYARLVDAAEKLDKRILLMVLLGGDAGLRRGEMLGLRQCDVDLRRNVIHVEQATWRGIEDVPKGGRSRIVPLTSALAGALKGNRHLRGPLVLHQDDGKPLEENLLQLWMEEVTRRAGLPVTRSLHILRHTFCSHLAMRGAPAKAIQELAGHQSLSTTLRYMHLSPAARENAIRLLDGARSGPAFGEMLEKAGGGTPK